MPLDLDAVSLFDFVVTEGNGIKGLVDAGISKVPDLYIQPEHERLKTNTNAQAVSLPIIDLSGLDGHDHDRVVESIVNAAETIGIFYIVNHGVPIELLEDVKGAAHSFFNQPVEKKALYMKDVSPSPSITYGTSFVPEKEKVFQWKDYCTMAYTSEDDALRYWPNSCKEAILKYRKLSTPIADTIFRILLENLRVELEKSIVDSYTDSKVVNMNFYPVCPDPELTVGIGKHSDIGTITVLLQDDIGGLVMKVEEDGNIGKKGEFIEVPPVAGALLINIGDVLEILSNGKYKSVEHQVRTPSSQSRVSIGYFLNPPLTQKIAPLPELVEKDGGTEYKECLFGDYKNHFFGQAYQGKRILDFAKINPLCIKQLKNCE